MSFSEDFRNRRPGSKQDGEILLPEFEVKARTFRDKKTEKNFNDLTAKYNQSQKNYLYDKVKDYKIKRRNNNLIDKIFYKSKPHVNPVTKSIVLPSRKNLFPNFTKKQIDEWVNNTFGDVKDPEKALKSTQLEWDRQSFLSEITHTDQIKKMGRLGFINKYIKKDLPMQMGIMKGDPYQTPGTLEYGHKANRENIRQGLNERSDNPRREFIRDLKMVKAKTWQEKMEDKNNSYES